MTNRILLGGLSGLCALMLFACGDNGSGNDGGTAIDLPTGNDVRTDVPVSGDRPRDTGGMDTGRDVAPVDTMPRDMTSTGTDMGTMLDTSKVGQPCMMPSDCGTSMSAACLMFQGGSSGICGAAGCTVPATAMDPIDGGCGNGFVCNAVNFNGNPIGVCFKTCDPTMPPPAGVGCDPGFATLVPACANDMECGMNAYCNMTFKACLPNGMNTMAVTGSACMSDADCNRNQTCLPAQDKFPGGYCSTTGCGAGGELTCEAGAECVGLFSNVPGGNCLKGCSTDMDCASRAMDGYKCLDPMTGMTPTQGPDAGPDGGTVFPGFCLHPSIFGM